MSRTRVWRPDGPVDVAATLSVHRRGRYDPAYRQVGSDVWWAFQWRRIPVTTRFTSNATEGAVEVTVWLDGDSGNTSDRDATSSDVADAVLGDAPSLLGADDDTTGFVPGHRLIERAVRQMPGLRLSRTGRVFDALVPAVLEQKVTSVEAYRGWSALLRWYGYPAPGPLPEPGAAPLTVPPTAEDIRRIPSWAWHRMGVGPQRSRTIVQAATVAAQLDATGHEASDRADRRLRALPGVGPWTSAEVRQRSHGDADAVSVGDANLPHHISWALATERRGSDERMLELLAPWPGHRHRVCDLLMRTTSGPPRRAPRAPVRDFRAM